MASQAWIAKRKALYAAMRDGFNSNAALMNAIRDQLVADGSTDLDVVVTPQRGVVDALNTLGGVLRAQIAAVDAMVPDDAPPGIPDPPSGFAAQTMP